MEHQPPQDHTLVNTIGDSCRVYREPSGRYLVRDDRDLLHPVHAATMAEAHAVCRGLEQRNSSRISRESAPG